MTLSLSRIISRWTRSSASSASLARARLLSLRRTQQAGFTTAPGRTKGLLGEKSTGQPVVALHWQRALLLSTTFLLTLGVVLLEVSSAAIFLGRMGIAALALVYGITAVLSFGLRELSLLRSAGLPHRFGVRATRLVTALAWVVLVGLWLWFCFGEGWGRWGDTLPGMAGLSQALSLREMGAEPWGQTGLQVVLLQCGATLLGQFHRTQIQGVPLPVGSGAGQAIASSKQTIDKTNTGSVEGLSKHSMAAPWQFLASLPLAWFTFGAYALVGLLLPWCLGAVGPSFPLASIALGSGLLILLGSILRLTLPAHLDSSGRPRLLSSAVATKEAAADAIGDDNAPPALLRRYGRLLLIFFALSQLLTLLIQWGLWGQLQLSFAGDTLGSTSQAVEIAVFLAWIQGAVGLAGLLLQATIAQGWFKRHGAFTALAWSPLVMLALSLLLVQEHLPLLLGLALLRGLDEGLHYSLGRFAQGRLLEQLPLIALKQLRQQRIVTESWVMGLLGVVLLLGWPILGEALPELLLVLLAGLTLATLVVLALLRYQYFQLILGAIAQQAVHHRFPHGPLEQLGAKGLLSQPESPLVKRGLVKSLKRALRGPIQLEEAISTIRLLDRLDPLLVVETLAPALMRLPPMLQLEGLTIMTRLGRQTPDQLRDHLPDPAQNHNSRSRRLRKRYRPQRYLRSVDALMTPIAPPAVFAAALRHRLYLGPAILPKALQLHLQPERSPAVRAVAAAFALNPLFGSALEASEQAVDAPQPRDRLAQSHWNALVPQAQAILQAMLIHKSQEERLAASEVLKDLADLAPFKAQVPALLEDFSPQVREAVIAAIGQTRSQALYPYLLKGLRSPLVEQPAHSALVQLGNEAVPLLQRCTQHPDLTLKTKERSWQILTEIGTPQSRAALAEDVLHQQGEARARLLTLLLKQPQGAIALSQTLAGSEGVMQLVREELWLLSHLYAALVELHPKVLPGVAARQLRQAINHQQRDVGERILLLLQIRYPAGRLDRVVQQLRDRSTIPQALKRLAQLLEPPLQEPLLAVFDARSAKLKRAAFVDWEEGEHCEPPERLRRLIALEPGLAPQGLVWAYELALEQEIALNDADLLRGINHKDGAVKTSAQTYLNQMSEVMVTELLEKS